MKDLVVSRILSLGKDPFDPSSMKWKGFFVSDTKGGVRTLGRVYSKRDERLLINRKHISEMNRADWCRLTDVELVRAFEIILRQAGKQF